MQYQLLPALTAEEYDALKADIGERGVQVPVEYDEQGYILDGHHRVQICQELGIPDWPRIVRQGMSEEQKIGHVLALNLNRRHLSREQRQELEATLRQLGMSTRDIAVRVGVSDVQVWRDLSGATYVAPEVITGRDGKSYPARKSTESQEPYDIPELSIDRPHVSFNSGDNEWYTPPEYIETARRVMGDIDLDPASSAIANRTVQAAAFYSADDSGLLHDWAGRVWMNPPYASELITKFCDKLTRHVQAGDVTECIILVNNATETKWFGQLISVADAIVFTSGRVRFLKPDGEQGAPLQGQAVLYSGPHSTEFIVEFSKFGWAAWLFRQNSDAN